jgi:FKBP-type peptidyl-prolyl cis-trans isomerase FklB
MKFHFFKPLITLGCLPILFTACGGKNSKEATRQNENNQSHEVSQPMQSAAGSGEPRFDTADQQASYGIGYNVGASILRDGKVEIDMDAMVAGLSDGLNQLPPQLGPEVLQNAMEALQKRNEEKEATTGGNNLSDSLEFLEKNAKREGIIVTSSGLQYEILRSNSDPNSPKPGITDQVEVHYHGTLIDGTVFDSSIQRGQTVTFPVAGVIPGWTEALQLMSVGDKWKLYLPPSIAYGSRQTASIPGNSALIFEVELIRILNGEGETIESP